MKELTKKIRYDVQFETNGRENDDAVGFTTKIVADDFESTYAWAKTRIGSEMGGYTVTGISQVIRREPVGVI